MIRFLYCRCLNMECGKTTATLTGCFPLLEREFFFEAPNDLSFPPLLLLLPEPMLIPPPTPPPRLLLLLPELPRPSLRTGRRSVYQIERKIYPIYTKAPINSINLIVEAFPAEPMLTPDPPPRLLPKPPPIFTPSPPPRLRPELLPLLPPVLDLSLMFTLTSIPEIRRSRSTANNLLCGIMIAQKRGYNAALPAAFSATRSLCILHSSDVGVLDKRENAAGSTEKDARTSENTSHSSTWSWSQIQFHFGSSL